MDFYFFVLFIFVTTLFILTIILYLLSCLFFNTGVEDEMSIERLSTYECGFAPFSDARDAFDIKFFLVAVLFLIFDLEVIFLLPLAVSLITANLFDICVILVFLFILTIGFFYEWKKGGLDW
jgi:NADH-quinone oxidoreductase subunit A